LKIIEAMVIKKLLVFWSISALLFICSSCFLVDEPVCRHGTYEFYISLNIEDEKDTILLGDTLWIVAKFSNQLDHLQPTAPPKFIETVDYSKGEIRASLSASILNVLTRTVNGANRNLVFVNVIGEIVKEPKYGIDHKSFISYY